MFFLRIENSDVMTQEIKNMFFRFRAYCLENSFTFVPVAEAAASQYF